MSTNAQVIIDSDDVPMTDDQYSKIEREAKKNWDIFYKNNKTNFYKDRHYLREEFNELGDAVEAEVERRKAGGS